LAPDRRLIFVRDGVQWEQTRKGIVVQLARYGYQRANRMCISVALDEAITFALDGAAYGGHDSAAMIAYSVSSRAFHVRIKLVAGTTRTVPAVGREGDDKNRWLLASACMSKVRVTKDGTEIDMWRDNDSSIDDRADAAETAATMPRRILMAEGDAGVLARLEEILSDAGYSVVACTNGWDLVHHLGYYLAPEEYRREEFDLILADTKLSGANGLDVLLGLRRRGIPPLALIVGTDRTEVEQRARRCGAAAILERSITPSELLRVIYGIVSADA
jgi:CheY-like chemotaxis protein